jgi:hypothetical protein
LDHQVWAQTLFVVTEAMVAKHGFSPSLFPPALNGTDSAKEEEFYVVNEKTGRKHPRHGNTYMLQVKQWIPVPPDNNRLLTRRFRLSFFFSF